MKLGGRDLKGTKTNPKNVCPFFPSEYILFSSILIFPFSAKNSAPKLWPNLRQCRECRPQGMVRIILCYILQLICLQSSVETKRPVRVIRGYKLDSPYAPESGFVRSSFMCNGSWHFWLSYRYDGLYTVERVSIVFFDVLLDEFNCARHGGSRV